MMFSFRNFALYILFCFSFPSHFSSKPIIDRQKEKFHHLSTRDYNGDETNYLKWKSLNEQKDNISTLFPVTNENIIKTCLRPVIADDTTFTRCNYKVEYDIQKDRIPQILPSIKCINDFPNGFHPQILGREKFSPKCEEVTMLFPALVSEKENNKALIFRSVWNTVSVACIQSTPISFQIEKLSATSNLENFL